MLDQSFSKFIIGGFEPLTPAYTKDVTIVPFVLVVIERKEKGNALVIKTDPTFYHYITFTHLVSC